MPRQPRLVAPGLTYHIIARGIERREIFKSERDYLFFLDRLGKILNDTGTKCYAFALLPNHFHLLLISEVAAKWLQGQVFTFDLTDRCLPSTHKKIKSRS